MDLVLFPGQELPLRVFEPRYKQLVDDCMLGDGQFGVCLIDDSEKIQGWQAPHNIGTVAKITKCQDIDIAGRHLSIETVGRGKFKIRKIIEPAVSLPYDYDPNSDEGLERMGQLHEKIGINEKLYIRAEIQMIPEITETIKLDQWKELVELWKEKIILQALPRVLNPFDLDQILVKYSLISEIPTIDYVYSLAALGAASPNELQPLLETDNLNDLIQKVKELFQRR